MATRTHTWLLVVQLTHNRRFNCVAKPTPGSVKDLHALFLRESSHLPQHSSGKDDVKSPRLAAHSYPFAPKYTLYKLTTGQHTRNQPIQKETTERPNDSWGLQKGKKSRKHRRRLTKSFDTYPLSLWGHTENLKRCCRSGGHVIPLEPMNGALACFARLFFLKDSRRTTGMFSNQPWTSHSRRLRLTSNI